MGRVDLYFGLYCNSTLKCDHVLYVFRPHLASYATRFFDIYFNIYTKIYTCHLQSKNHSICSESKHIQEVYISLSYEYYLMNTELRQKSHDFNQASFLHLSSEVWYFVSSEIAADIVINSALYASYALSSSSW